ncbi:hypothetical protein AKJ53_00300, partial [candidate division MSBL1 archaeon SCGC-AAA382F02]
KNDVVDRKSIDICHRKEFAFSSISELEKLRNSLKEVTEEPIELLEDFQDEIEKITNEKVNTLIPFSIKPNSLEGFLALFLWFRKPGGGFEFQLYRFLHENYKKIPKGKEIREALLRLEVHGYTEVKETPNEIRKRMENKGIQKCRRFYETGKTNIPGRELFNKLKSKITTGAYLAPLPRKKLVKSLKAPDHLVNKAIRDLTRKGYLSQRNVKDSLGRTVRKIKPKRSPRRITGLEKRVVKEAREFYNVQKNSLDDMQEERP